MLFAYDGDEEQTLVFTNGKMLSRLKRQWHRHNFSGLCSVWSRTFFNSPEIYSEHNILSIDNGTHCPLMLTSRHCPGSNGLSLRSIAHSS